MTNLNWPSIPVVGPLSKILVCVHSSPGWYSTFVRPSRHVIGCCCTIWGLPSAVKVPGFSFFSVSKSTRWLIWYESYRMGLSHMMAHILGLNLRLSSEIWGIKYFILFSKRSWEVFTDCCLDGFAWNSLTRNANHNFILKNLIFLNKIGFSDKNVFSENRFWVFFSLGFNLDEIWIKNDVFSKNWISTDLIFCWPGLVWYVFGSLWKSLFVRSHSPCSTFK